MPKLAWSSNRIFGNVYKIRDVNIVSVNIYIGEGNGTPLQYSCLENPMDGGAW